MRLVDLCCKAGGSSRGYADAGFEVWGVDIEPQPNYPYPDRFIQADALSWIAEHGHEFDVIAASPPCQGYSWMTPTDHQDNHAQLIDQMRDILRSIGRPFVIENVGGARYELSNPMKLCGSMFGLPIFRHRYFEVWPELLMLTPPCRHDLEPVLITDHGGPNANGPGKPRKRSSRLVKLEAMGIDWYMNDDEVSNAVPPAFTAFIGRQLMDILERIAA